MKFPEKVRYCRKTFGYTQQQLASQLHVSKRTVAYYEAGQRDPSAETLDAISKVFKVSISFLLIDEEESPGQSFIEESYRIELNRYKESPEVKQAISRMMAAGDITISIDTPEYEFILESVAKVIMCSKGVGKYELSKLHL